MAGEEVEVLCLGCMNPVGGQPGCNCRVERRAAATSPYRSEPIVAPCPRCRAPLADEEAFEITAPSCRACGGVFLERSLVASLSNPKEVGLRIAIARLCAGTRRSEEVRYVPCIVCGKLMNRTAFARVSGICVDSCKDHGIWLDGGELEAMLTFISSDKFGKGLQREREVQHRMRQRDATRPTNYDAFGASQDLSVLGSDLDRAVDVMRLLGHLLS